MPEQLIREARGLLTLAVARAERPEDGLTVPAGVRGHLIAARTQLDAAAALIALTEASTPKTKGAP